MGERFIAFDVETPNAFNDRMSAIGIAVVENGMITDEFSTVINPETWFHPFHIHLTGITPEMAEEASSFEQLWPSLEPVMSSGLLVAHNAPFDMRVLAKCLHTYGIIWKDTVQYVCTCQIGRRLYPHLPDHKLNTLCAYLDIDLDHHQAGSDSRACAELLINYLDHDADINAYLRKYDLINGRTLQSVRHKKEIPT